MSRRRAATVTGCLLVAVIAVAGCTVDEPTPTATPNAPGSIAPTDATASPGLPPDVPSATPLTAPVPSADTDLRTELLAMMEADQQERTGAGLPPGTKLPPSHDLDRAQRLRRIVEQRGWPTRDEVGTDGSTAAWLVAQHADFDVAFQQWALRHLTTLVEDGQADRTEAAYLADRIAVNTGATQLYGSQVRCRDGVPRPATPLTRPRAIDALRHRVGMDPLETYYAELSMMCADEQAAGQPAGPG